MNSSVSSRIIMPDSIRHPVMIWTTPMKPYYFKSMRARLTVYLVLPVIFLLLAGGVSAFLFARDRMIDQFHKRVTLQLERAAQKIEQRLSKPIELMRLFANSGISESNDGLLEVIVERLETLPEVARVNLTWHAATDASHHRGRRSGAMGIGRMMRFNRGTITSISIPAVEESTSEQTVSVTMILLDAADTTVGNLEIVLKLNYLISGLTTSPWWQNTMACIADRKTGRIVLASGLMQGRTMLGETGSPLERSIKTDIAEKTVGTLWPPGHPPDRVAGFHSLETFPWALVVFSDGKAALAPIITFRNGFLIGALILVALVAGIIHLTIGQISNTIQDLARRALAVAAGDYGETIKVRSKDEIGQLSESFNRMIEGLREKEMIQRTFGRYVDADFARILLKKPEVGRLGGRRQDVIVLMTDIRGFTPMTKNLPPEKTIEMLNGYFSAMIPLIQKYRGIIVDFVGDGILAFFEPINESLPEATHRCLQCAFDMHAGIGQLNREMAARHLPALKMGIGINCGPVVVGNIGSETRKKYGIVGAPVNVTQRIQAVADAGEVVISNTILEMAETQITVLRNFSAPLKGVASTMHLYAVVPKTTNV